MNELDRNMMLIGKIIKAEIVYLKECIEEYKYQKLTFWQKINPFRKKTDVEKYLDESIKKVEDRLSWLYEAWQGRYDHVFKDNNRVVKVGVKEKI